MEPIHTDISGSEELDEHFESEDDAHNDLVEMIGFFGPANVIGAIVDLNLDDSPLKQRSRRTGNLCEEFISSVSHGLNSDALSLPMAEWLANRFGIQEIQEALLERFEGKLAGFNRMITDLEEGIRAHQDKAAQEVRLSN
jgi:hypothetical protein